MRTHSAAEEAVLKSYDYKTHYEIRLGTVTISYLSGRSDESYNPFISGSIEARIDQPVQTATFAFHLGKVFDSLSPYLTDGIKNEARTYPALWPGERISLRTACCGPGEDPELFWRYVFIGRIDSVDVDPARDLVTVKCRDLFAEVQDHWIDTLSQTDQGYIFGFPVAAGNLDVVLQSIIDQTYGVGSGPSLYVRGTPTLALGAYWQESIGTLDALRQKAQLAGWDCRGLWDVLDTDTYTLTLYEPDRAKTASDLIFVGLGAAQLRYNSLRFSSSLVNVRNLVYVIPADDLRVPVSEQDNASITQYGQRFMLISEDRSSGIDTPDEAVTLAHAAKLDLKDPPTAVEIGCGYQWIWELNDLLKIDQDIPSGGSFAFSYDQDITFAVSGIVHTFAESGEATTTLTAAPAPKSTTREYRLGDQPQSYVKLTDPSGPGKEGATWYKVESLDPPTVL